MNGIQLSSLLAIIAGIMIIAFPNILETLVALILIVIGAVILNGLIFGAKMKKYWRVKLDK